MISALFGRKFNRHHLVKVMVMGLGLAYAPGAWPKAVPEPSSEVLHHISAFPGQPHQDPLLPFPYVNARAPKGGKIVFGVKGGFDRFDLFSLKGTPAAGLDLLYATLFKRSSEEVGSAYPYAAESVEIKPDKIIFTLRPGLTFHDGTLITPEDVVFSFQHVIKQSEYHKSYYGAVTKVEALGEDKVVFFLKPKAARETALILSEIPIMSKAFMETSRSKPLATPVGSGPYRIAEFRQGDFVRYERVAGWWGENLPVNQGFYNFQTVQFNYYGNEIAVFEALKKGDVHVYEEAMARNWQHGYQFPAVVQGKVKKEEVPHKAPVPHVGFIFNTRRPLFQDPRVRQAIALMFDFEEMNKNLFFGDYQRLTSLFQNTDAQAQGVPSGEEAAVMKSLSAPLAPGVETDAIEDFTLASGTLKERKEKALGLLKEAGWHLENGFLRSREGEKFQFSILIHDENFEKVCQRLILALKSIGISVKIEKADKALYTQRLNKFDFDMIYGVLASSEIPGMELKSHFGSDAAGTERSANYAGVGDKAVDQIIKKIVACETYEDLVNHAKVLDRIIMSGHYHIPGWTMSKQRIAYWNKFGKPLRDPSRGVNFMTWWEQPLP